MTRPRQPEQHFEAPSKRLAHIQRVVRNAEFLETRRSFGGRLMLAAIYHDIGYAPDLAKTGFHPVDGAMIAKADGMPAEVVEAVLHHTGSYGEAVRTRLDLLNRYPEGCLMMSTALTAALTYCDLRAGPNGQFVTVAQRLADIRKRHASNAALLANIDAYEGRFCELEREFGHLFW